MGDFPKGHTAATYEEELLSFTQVALESWHCFRTYQAEPFEQAWMKSSWITPEIILGKGNLSTNDKLVSVPLQTICAKAEVVRKGPAANNDSHKDGAWYDATRVSSGDSHKLIVSIFFMELVEPSMKFSVSIVLCTYNGQSYLKEQLESLSMQTRLPDELIVQDDGSTDGTIQMVHDFAASAEFPVRIFNNAERLGFAANFLSAAEKAQGTLIAFCDQDDVWLPEKLERCEKVLADQGVQCVVHSATLIDGNGKQLGSRYPDIRASRKVDFSTNDPWFAPPGFAVVCRRSLVTDYDWHARPRCHFVSDGSAKPHDQWIYFLASALGKVALLGDVLAFYRQHGSNAAGAPNDTWASRLSKASGAGAELYFAKASFAHEYADFYRKLASSGTSEHADGFLGAAEMYDRVALRETRRAIQYSAHGRIKRLYAFIQSVFHGDYYLRSRGYLGIRSFAKDFVCIARASA